MVPAQAVRVVTTDAGEEISLAASLAARYVDVLLLDLLGWNDAAVARRLGIDEYAVPNLRRLALRKLRAAADDP